MKRYHRWVQATMIVCGLCCFNAVDAIAAPPLDFESEPINYTSATPNNVVSQLQAAIDQGDKSLPFEDQFGYGDRF